MSYGLRTCNNLYIAKEFVIYDHVHSRYQAENDDFSIILLKAIADRLAEV